MFTEKRALVSVDGKPTDPPTRKQASVAFAVFNYDPVEAPAWLATEEIVERPEVEIRLVIQWPR